MKDGPIGIVLFFNNLLLLSFLVYGYIGSSKIHLWA